MSNAPPIECAPAVGIGARQTHFTNKDDGYKETNPDTGLRIGYTLKPRQDLCILRFTEYCKRNGMLLLHNVGSGKTVTSSELFINLFSWLTQADFTALNANNPALQMKQDSIAQIELTISAIKQQLIMNITAAKAAGGD